MLLPKPKSNVKKAIPSEEEDLSRAADTATVKWSGPAGKPANQGEESMSSIKEKDKKGSAVSTVLLT